MGDEKSHNDGHDKPQKMDEKQVEFPLQEYRLVPVKDWEEGRDTEKEIDLVELFNYIWGQRIFIAKITGIFVALGLLVALLSPIEYQTEATLIPEFQSQQSRAGNLLQQYGGILGFSGNLELSQDGMISPQLYPIIVESIPFQLELLNRKVTFADVDTTTTVYNYFNEVYAPSILSYIAEYTIGLPSQIKGFFTDNLPEQPFPKGFKRDSVISVTKEQMGIIEEMRERITVNHNDESSILTLTAEMPDANAAAEVGQAGIDLLKKYVTNYRTQKTLRDLKFAQEQMARAKLRFEEAQDRLAEFDDSNVGKLTAKAQTQRQRLQSNYDLAFNVYNTLAQHVEKAKLKVQEQTPVVSVLEPIKIPIEKSKPKRKLILIVSLFIGSFISLGLIIFKYLKIIKKIWY